MNLRVQFLVTRRPDIRRYSGSVGPTDYRRYTLVRSCQDRRRYDPIFAFTSEQREYDVRQSDTTGEDP